MNRRSFLKRLAGITLAAMGTPEETVARLFRKPGKKVRLDAAVRELAGRQDAQGLITLMSDTYAACAPDLRLSGAVLSYWVLLGGEIAPVVKQARQRRNEPGTGAFLAALRAALMEERGQWRSKAGGYHALLIETTIIAGIWHNDIDVAIYRHLAVEGRAAVLEYCAAFDVECLYDLAKKEVEIPVISS